MNHVLVVGGGEAGACGRVGCCQRVIMLVWLLREDARCGDTLVLFLIM